MSAYLHFAELGPEPGAMIVAPLRGADRIRGVLTIERLGAEASFTDEEFELVKLFAAHVSIALQNAEAHRAVELRAETDTLTGLWNHGALIEHIDRLVSSRSRFAMLMVDLDFFKHYNDRFGHQAGNVMLQRIAEQLRASCRDTDQRLPLRRRRVRADPAEHVARRARGQSPRRSRQPCEAAATAANAHAGLTCSIGIAVYPATDGDRRPVDHPRRRPRLLRGQARRPRPDRDRDRRSRPGRRIPADRAEPLEPIERQRSTYTATDTDAGLLRRLQTPARDDAHRSPAPRYSRRLDRVALVLGDAQPPIRVLVEQVVAVRRPRRRSCAQVISTGSCAGAVLEPDLRPCRRGRGRRARSADRPSGRPA